MQELLKSGLESPRITLQRGVHDLGGSAQIVVDSAEILGTGMTAAPAYTAVIGQDGPWWIGWVEEVPGVNAQEQSREALMESRREILREALEFNRQDALEAAGPGAEEFALVL